MTRINVYDYPAADDYLSDGPTFAGWFDVSKAERWDDADYNGNGNGGTGRGQAVIRTSQGRWVLQHWTRWQGESGRHEYITDEQARDWLLRNNEDEAVAKYFGQIAEEEDRRPGRPAIGGAVHVRLGDDLLAMVEDYASRRSIGQAEAIRRLVTDAVTRERASR